MSDHHQHQNQQTDLEPAAGRVRYNITRQSLAELHGGGCRRCGCKDYRELVSDGSGGRMFKKVCRFCGEPRG